MTFFSRCSPVNISLEFGGEVGLVGGFRSSIFHKAFGYDMIMPFRSANYLRCDWLGTECLSEFALLFSSGDDPISSTCKL